jgi:uncharacterized protein YxjI
MQIKGKAFSLRDRMSLLDENNQPLAVCLRKFDFVKETFNIYTTKPMFPGQKPSEIAHENRAQLYTYCTVERVPFSAVQNVTFANEKSPSFTIHRGDTGIFGPKKRFVKRHGIPAALMEGGTWGNCRNSYLLTINPGIDPCLIICLAAICDEMDEN